MEGGGFVDCVEGVDKVEGRVCPDGSGVVDCVEAVDGCAVRNKQHSVALRRPCYTVKLCKTATQK